MDSNESSYDRERSLDSYLRHVPKELHELKIWMPCIARQPLLTFTGEKKKNLMTLSEATDKLQDTRWVEDRRAYYVKTKGEKFKTGLPHLAAIFTDTDYCYVDPDHRWLLDDQGNKLTGEDGKKLGNKDAFDQDQIDAMAKIKDFCPGWYSWSGKGFHGLMKRSDKITHITADKVNKLVDGKFLSPFELKLHTCFLPPYLEPINDIEKIPSALPFVEELCQAISSRASKSKSTSDKPPLEQAIDKANREQGTSPAPAPAPARVSEADLDRLLDQYWYLNRHDATFIPRDHASYGGWHRRLTTMGLTKDKIKELAKGEPGFVDGKDDNDIDNSKPYDDPEQQARIEFSRVKDLFDYHKFSLADANDYRARYMAAKEIAKANKGIVDWQSLIRPETVGTFAPRGEVALLAAKAGTGKSCLTLARIAEISKQGFKTLYLSGDMNLVDMRPHLMANKTVLSNFRAIDDLTLLTGDWLNEIMKDWRPDLIVMDGFIDCISCLAGEFMYDRQTKKMGKFDPNNDPMTWVKVFGWLKPWAKHWNVSIFGMVHPAKDRFGHDLPHSSKLQGYLHRWDMLYRKGSNMKGFQYSAVAELLDGSPEGTRLEWNGKRRRNTERMHTIYGLKEADLADLHIDDRDEKILVMANVVEYADTDELLGEFDECHDGYSTGYKPKKVLDEESIYRKVRSLVEAAKENTDKDYITSTAFTQSLARRDETKKNRIEEYLDALHKRQLIFLQSSGRGFKIRLNPDIDSYTPAAE